MEQALNLLIEKGGLLGVALVLSIFVIKSLWTELRETKKELQTKIDELQDKRFEEHKGYIERMLTAFGTNTEVTKTAADGFKTLVVSNGEIKQELVKLAERIPSKGGRAQ